MWKAHTVFDCCPVVRIMNGRQSKDMKYAFTLIKKSIFQSDLLNWIYGFFFFLLQHLQSDYTTHIIGVPALGWNYENINPAGKFSQSAMIQMFKKIVILIIILVKTNIRIHTTLLCNIKFTIHITKCLPFRPLALCW